MINTSFYKLFEFSLIFIFLPFLFLYRIVPLSYILYITWAACFYSFFILDNLGLREYLNKLKIVELIYVIKRFILIAIMIYIFTYLFYEEKLFKFLLENTKIYIFVMILYPVLSVFPQEIIFRKFFYYRYGLFFTPYALIILNGIIFGFAHIIFENYIALVFTIVGGFIFMSTYIKTKSILLVFIEHSLYGNLLFTIGLGDFFIMEM